MRYLQVIIDNLKLQAASAGVDPARLIFAPFVSWQENVQRGFAADLFLDTPMYSRMLWSSLAVLTTGRYNAHSTGVNALWASVPILSLPDQVCVMCLCPFLLLTESVISDDGFQSRCIAAQGTRLTSTATLYLAFASSTA